MAYSSWGRFKATAGEALTIGSLVDMDFKDADATAGENHAEYVVIEDIASGKEGWFAKGAVVKKPSTIGAGGAVTRGDHGGTAGDVLFLSTTAGEAKEVPDGDGVLQVVGRVLSQDTVLLEPSKEYWDDMELETANKTLDADDCGKVIATATDAVVVTLPAGAGLQGLTFTIINVGQDGDALVSVSPNSADNFQGFDHATTDDKDIQNTKATARCMDRVKVISDGTATNSVYYIIEQVGTWADES